MREWGEVVAVQEHYAMVRLVRHGACGTCRLCGMKANESEMVLRAVNRGKAGAGDRAQVALPRAGRALAFSLRFAVPLLFLALGLLIGLSVTVDGIEKQFAATAFAVAAMAIAFLAVRMLEPVWRKARAFWPIVTETVRRQDDTA